MSTVTAPPTEAAMRSIRVYGAESPNDSAPDQAPPAGVPSVYAKWGLSDCQSAVRRQLPGFYEENRRLVEDGDHWQKGKGYIGKKPNPRSPRYAQKTKELEEAFCVRDAVGECTGAAVDAVVNQEAELAFNLARAVTEREPETPAEAQVRADAHDLGTRWWDHVDLQDLLGDAVRASRWARRGHLRLALPPGLLMDDPENPGRKVLGRRAANGTVEGLTFEEALMALYVTAPLPDVCAIVVDPSTRQRAGVYLDGKDAAELYYVEDGLTVFRRVHRDKARDSEVRIPMGGLLPIMQIKGRLLITDAVRKQQKKLNYAETVGNHLMTMAGHPERVTVDAAPSGEWVRMADDEMAPPNALVEERDGARWMLMPEPRIMGPDVITEIVSRDVETKEGAEVKPFQASVERFEPTSQEDTRASADAAYANILVMCRQGHRLTQADARQSAPNRQQQRADHENDARYSKGKAEPAMRGILGGAFHVAEYLSSSEGTYTEQVRPVVNLHINTGPPLAEDIDSNTKQVEAGLMRPETAMSRNGIEDTKAEIEGVRGSPEAQAKHLGTLATTYASLRMAEPNGDPVELAIIAGYPEEEARKRFAHLRTARAQAAAEDEAIRAAEEERRGRQGAGDDDEEEGEEG